MKKIPGERLQKCVNRVYAFLLRDSYGPLSQQVDLAQSMFQPVPFSFVLAITALVLCPFGQLLTDPSSHSILCHELSTVFAEHFELSLGVHCIGK